VSVTPFTEGKERFCLIEVSDISTTVGRERQLRGQAEALRAQSYVDGLTGIANRRHFDVALDRELRRAIRNDGQLSLLLMDIDSFKAYNDHFRPSARRRLPDPGGGSLRRHLATPGRPGGALRRRGIRRRAAGHRAGTGGAGRRNHPRQNRLAGHHPLPQAAARPHVTMSIGVASFDKDRLCEAAAILAAADRCLYAAKHAGRDCVIVDSPQENAA
jgi:GGDEF domain-containing protein